METPKVGEFWTCEYGINEFFPNQIIVKIVETPEPAEDCPNLFAKDFKCRLPEGDVMPVKGTCLTEKWA